MKTKEECRKAISELSGKEGKRVFDIDTAGIDEEERTIDIALSSETPYQRWYGIEILVHEAQSILLDRLNNNAAFLLNHNYDQQVGVIVPGSARIDKDKVLRCKIRFSKSEFNKEALQAWDEIKDGIRTKISVGYKINKYIVEVDEENDKNPDTIRVTEWEPIEGSLVSVPADDTVGVGRSAEEPTFTIKEKEERKMEKTTEEILREERERVSKIEAAFAKFQSNISGLAEIKDSFIRDGKPYQGFFDVCLEKMDSSKPLETPKSFLDMSSRDKKAYSISRAINNIVEGRFAGSIEAEASEEIAKRLKKEARGGAFFLPYELQRAAINTGTGDTPKGGYLAGTTHLANEYIPALRNTSVLDKLGARRLTGLSANIDIPVMLTPATFSFVLEGSPASQTLQGFGQKTASPKTGSANTEYTRKLLMQSNPSIDALITEDLDMVAQLGVDAAAINGTGLNNQPRGLLATTGIGSVDGSAGISITEILEFRKDVKTAYGDRGDLKWALNPDVEALLMGTEKSSGYPVYIMGEDGKIIGSMSVVSNQIASGNLIYGDFSQLVVCEFGITEILVNPYNAGGNIKVEIFKDIDVVVRYASAFSASTNVLLT